VSSAGGLRWLKRSRSALRCQAVSSGGKSTAVDRSLVWSGLWFRVSDCVPARRQAPALRAIPVRPALGAGRRRRTDGRPRSSSKIRSVTVFRSERIVKKNLTRYCFCHRGINPLPRFREVSSHSWFHPTPTGAFHLAENRSLSREFVPSWAYLRLNRFRPSGYKGHEAELLSGTRPPEPDERPLPTPVRWKHVGLTNGGFFLSTLSSTWGVSQSGN
jgi:hypothetical protein